MKTILKTLINNKKVLILGFGREGRSTLREITDAGNFQSITIADAREITAELPANVSTVTGENYLECLDDYDIVFKSPGVVLPKHADEYKAVISSEVDVFLKAYGKQAVGITGTKGKSTTSSLIAHVLKSAGKEVLFAGNIGIPVFDIWKEVTQNTIIVLELSCHQLEFLKYAPHNALLLNIYEDHLDHYGTREKYAAAKKNIYLKQGAEDILFTIEEERPDASVYEGKTVCVEKTDAPFSDFDEVSGATLKGKHNVLNCAFAYAVTKNFGVDEGTFINAVGSFKGLPHRLEYIGTKNGIDFYDDSISTTVKSAISAVESIKNAGVLLLGGMERNLEYGELIDYICSSKLDSVVFMYASGRRMYDMYTAKDKDSFAPKAYLAKDLSEAVNCAKNNAKEGKAVILSPAAASYDSFKNFEERGDVYKSLVF